MAPNKRFPAHKSTSLKQGTLGFTSSKQTASSATAKGKKSSPAPVLKKRKSTDTNPDDLETSIQLSQDQDGGTRKSTNIISLRSQPREGLEYIRDSEKMEMESLDFQDRSGRWRNHYDAVKRRMGHLQPIHAEGQTKVHLILRVFDLSAEYGPCVGVTRMERWERARALGLNPPIEVHDILSTREGREDDQYLQCVFHDQV